MIIIITIIFQSHFCNLAAYLITFKLNTILHF